jgi:hypothetical protein
MSTHLDRPEPLQLPPPSISGGRLRAAVFSARVDSTVLLVLWSCAVVAILGAVGADARWLAALGGIIVETGGIPDGVPYASAASAGWPNVPALAEVIFHVLEASLGDRGLLLAQVAATGFALAILSADIRRGFSGGRVPVLVLVVLGSFSALVAARVQLFSLVLFPLAVALLRAEARRPSRRIWLLVPLVALWTNLHGAALLGVAVAGAYLLFERSRREPLVAFGVLGCSIVALGCTPSLWRTFDYYRGVFENEAARQGLGLWGRLDVRDPLDLILIVSAVALLALAVRSRPPLWEAVALAGVTLMTIDAGRSGVWLLFLAALPACRGLGLAHTRTVPRLALAPLIAVAALGLIRGPLPLQADAELVADALHRAGRTPILAEAVPAEQIAVAGGKLWLANPLDAFGHADQRLYLAWLEGDAAGDAALARAPRVVVVMRGSAAQRRMATRPSFREVRRDARAILYQRIL